MRKITSILLISIISLVFMMGIINDKCVSVNASSLYDSELSYSETINLNKIAEKTLGLNDFDYEIIDGFNTQNKHVLVEGNNCYLIYDREIRYYIEYSRTSNSILSDLTTQNKMYLAPTYYFAETNEKVLDLTSGSVLTNVELTRYQIIEDELAENYLSNIQMSDIEYGASYSLLSSTPSSPKYIDNSYYFENLADNMGDNTSTSFSGSCSYVALNMLLSYYDTIVNDDVIAENFDITETINVSNINDVRLENFPQSPGVNNDFHNYIITLGQNNGYTEAGDNSISLTDMDNLMNDYFEIRNMSITTHNTNLFTNKVDFCKSAIDSNNPVIIQITGTDTSLDPRDLNHAVIGYGYNDSGIFVNFGWQGTFTNVNINNYSIPRAFYLELNEEHKCSNNYNWRYFGCSGNVCSCGEVVYYHSYDNGYLWKNSRQHLAVCDCGASTLQGHAIVSGTNKCILCGGNADMGFIQINALSPQVQYVTDNGRFILPNGVIELMPEDVEAYLHNILVFYPKNDNLVTE